MIARRPAIGLLAALLALGGVAGCSGDGEAAPAALPSAVTTPAAPASTAAGIPAVGAPIVPTERSTTTRTSRPRTTTRSPSRSTTPSRRTVTVPDDFGQALFRCLESGRSYDECVD